MAKIKPPLPIIGWREWIAFPEFGIQAVNTKIDTGAKTSALHAIHVEEFERDGQAMVHFEVHPLQRNSHITAKCEAPLLEHRKVRSSNGQQTKRPVVQVLIELHGRRFPIELTLTNRDEMGFRMLLGREAMKRRFVVDCSQSYCDKTHVPPKKVRSKRRKVEKPK